MKNNGIKIKSINGAEVLKLKDGRQEEYGKAVFSNSLLLDKLKELGLAISKQGGTNDIISLKFDYKYTSQQADKMIEDYNIIKANNKLIKKDNKETIARIKQLNKMIEKAEGKLVLYKEEIELLEDEKEINKLNEKIGTRKAKLEKYKSELSEIDKECINEISNNNDAMKQLEKNIDENTYKKDEIRDLLYTEGFSLDTYKTVNKEKVFDKTITYKFWFRTTGKAKKGEDYFINSELFDEIDKWQRMGIELPQINAKLVEMEAYKSLVASAIEDYIVIKPSEILVVSDLYSYSDMQDVIKIIRNEITGESEAIHTREQCKNTIWDGMCLLQGGKGFRGLRHHFYKTGAFCCNFQKYFKEYYKENYETATIVDRYNREVKVKDIKMITTENAMKWEKFLGVTKEAFEEWAKWVEENGCKFGICKRNHASKYGSKQRMSYQIIQTLPIKKDNVEELFADSKEYINKLQNDDKFFVEHLKRTKSDVNNNLLLADLATTYPTFINSYYFKDNRKAEINKYKDTLKKGKLLCEGDNETILANPMLLLKYCTGQLDEYIKDGVIEGYADSTLPNKNSCYCKRFKDGEEIGAFRSPHNSVNNILHFENVIDEEMDKYFSDFGTNVIAVNMLENDVQDRGNGMDEDTDFLLCTNNKLILEACKKAQSYPTIVNGFVQTDKTYNNTMEDLAKVDCILQNSQKAIGTSSNVAQLYLSQYWDMINKQDIETKEIEDYNYHFIDKVTEDEEIKKLLDNVCILSVLAQVSVDSSKRAFKVGNGDDGLNKEINRIRKELPAKAKPIFWQYTSSEFENKEIEKSLKTKNGFKQLSKKEKQEAIKEEKKNMINSLVDFNCPFNWILKEIDKIKSANTKNRVPDANFLVAWGDKKTQDRKQATKVEKLAQDFTDATKFIKSEAELDTEEENKYYSLLYREFIKKICGLNIKQDTMSLLIKRALDKDNKFLRSNKQIRTKLLNMLYKYNRDSFIKCFKDYLK
ncbi:hypothetical protein GCM10008908_09350 [Clostridium subterminale]|uniref:Uncharacterized protein n=1 Tax=Clostridium subterminale TaxID=1550 RepID=A0ABN1KJG8_CLOSU